ncbi:MAG: hypothetical protein J6D87_06920 [Clostridia bacterium]|nr:hypothetical protein [Clostridia bacterium]
MIGFIPYAICFFVLSAACLLLPLKQKTKNFAVALLLISLACEVLVCNFHSFHLLGGDYEPYAVPLQSETVTVAGGEEKTPLTTKKGGKLEIVLKDLKRPVGTLRLDLAFSDEQKDEKGKVTVKTANYADVKISIKDVTQSANYRSGVADAKVIRDDERSAYTVLDLTGDVSDMKVVVTAPANATVTLQSMTLNERIPMQFSAVRLILFVLECMAVYALVTAACMKKTFGESPMTLYRTTAAVTAVMLIGALIVTWVSMYDQTGGISTGFHNLTGNQITQEIVDAFRAGQVHLLAEPSEELLAMENPYDWSARSALGVSAKWDHLLFDGKYYSYYGIAPVLLLFLPYNLLTGYYFPTAEAVFLFGAVGILFLSLLFLEFAKIFCKKIPNSILVSTLVILQFSSGVWYNFVYDNFYEIAQASGFMFTCMGFFFLLRSRVIGEGKILYRHLVLSTMCLSWAVLCRPTLALYCVVACIFIVFGYLKHREEIKAATSVPSQQKSALKRATVKYLFASLTCFVVIGGIQVVYNYARFGNPLDFGIQYSLTINDFTRSQYHTDFVMIGLYNFLFAFPNIQPEFPYVMSNFSTLSTNGYYFVANRNAIGILWRALPSLGYLGAVPAWRSLSKKEKIQALCLLIPTCVIAPLIIIFSIWESGYGVRYCCDFAWQIILGGAAVLYLLYVRVAEGQGKTILRHAFTVAMVLAVIVNGAMIYDYLEKIGYLAGDYLRFSRIFDFWM